MKKLLAIILALVCITAAAAAETDLSGLSFDELMKLRAEIQAEIMSRPEWKEVTVPSGTWTVGPDIPAGVYSISATTKGGYIRVRRKNKLLISQGIRNQESAFGRVELLEGDIVEIERGSLIFSPPKGLGF